jgi:hypothetical protein
VGAEIRNGVGIASAGGILAAGILTAIVVPTLDSLLTRRRNHTGPLAWLRRRFRRPRNAGDDGHADLGGNKQPDL